LPSPDSSPQLTKECSTSHPWKANVTNPREQSTSRNIENAYGDIFFIMIHTRVVEENFFVMSSAVLRRRTPLEVLHVWKLGGAYVKFLLVRPSHSLFPSKLPVHGVLRSCHPRLISGPIFV
jgi:hypothetical protein